MDALRNLTTNIPVWQRRLDELSSQIDKRQIELAQLAESSPKSAEVRSLRNKGSTESLKPPDDGPMHLELDRSAAQPPRDETTALPVLAISQQTAAALVTAAQLQLQHERRQHQHQHQQQNASSREDTTSQSHPSTTSHDTCANPAETEGESPLTKPIPGPTTTTTIIDDAVTHANHATINPTHNAASGITPETTNEKTNGKTHGKTHGTTSESANGTTNGTAGITSANANANANAIAARCPPPRTKKRTASVASVECAHDGKQFRPASITRSMLIVYYDSYVQGFFDDMVRFISSSRNLMRKAKMAAKVAQIKRLAEMETPSGDGQNADDKAAAETLPSLRFLASRQLGPSTLRYSSIGAKSGPPDVYDELDKALEFVQSTCEHGAHQFLRDANCNEELKKIQKRMDEVLETATKEAERILREEPELAKETSDQYKPRMRRPITMSRNLVASHKADSEKAPGPAPAPAPAPGPADSPTRLEIADFVRKCPLVLPGDGHIEVDMAADSVVKTSAEPTMDVDSPLPSIPLPQEPNTGSMRHPRIIPAE